MLEDRTLRSGIFELTEVSRPDRRFYCQSEYFKRMMLEQTARATLESECRDQLADRIFECNDEFCPPCVARCTSPTLEALAGTVKVHRGLQLQWAGWLREVSDQGQLIKALHGAIRSTGYDAVPERRALHEFAILLESARLCAARQHLVPQGAPLVDARHFAHGFDSDGSLMVRSGFHVACVQDADCYRACGRHPLHGGHYVCQHNFVYYDVGVTSDDAMLRNSSAASGDTYDVEPGQGCASTIEATSTRFVPLSPWEKPWTELLGAQTGLLVNSSVGCPLASSTPT